MGSERREYFLKDLYTVSSGLSKPAKDFGEGYPFVSFIDVLYNCFLPNGCNRRSAGLKTAVWKSGSTESGQSVMIRVLTFRFTMAGGRLR